MTSDNELNQWTRNNPTISQNVNLELILDDAIFL